VPEDFVIARNVEPGSTLPYLLRIPLGDEAAPPLAPAPPTPADVRRWATANDVTVSDRGRIPAAVMDLHLADRARREN
jgi:hypothetical protein